MKKLFFIIIVLFCSIYISAEIPVSVSSSTVQNQTLNNQTQQKDSPFDKVSTENDSGMQVATSTSTINVSSTTKDVATLQVNKSSDTLNVSTNTVNNNTMSQVINSTDTVNVSTATIQK